MNKISIKNRENNTILWSSDKFLSSQLFTYMFNKMQFIMFFEGFDSEKGRNVRELFA